MGPHLKVEYQILLMQLETAQKVMQSKERVLLILLLLD